MTATDESDLSQRSTPGTSGRPGSVQTARTAPICAGSARARGVQERDGRGDEEEGEEEEDEEEEHFLIEVIDRERRRRRAAELRERILIQKVQFDPAPIISHRSTRPQCLHPLERHSPRDRYRHVPNEPGLTWPHFCTAFAGGSGIHRRR